MCVYQCTCVSVVDRSLASLVCLHGKLYYCIIIIIVHYFLFSLKTGDISISKHMTLYLCYVGRKCYSYKN